MDLFVGKLSSATTFILFWLLLFGFVGQERRKCQDKMFIEMRSEVFQSGGQRWRLITCRK